MREPVPAQTFDKTLRDAPMVKPLQPGQPVRVMPDLKESPKPAPDEPVTPDTMNKDSQEMPSEEAVQPTTTKPTPEEPPQPVVRKPVKPKVMEKPLDEAPKAKEMKPGEPIMVMPDLKQQDSLDSDPEVTKPKDKQGE